MKPQDDDDEVPIYAIAALLIALVIMCVAMGRFRIGN